MITRKIQLFPIGDKEEISRVYKYLRDGIENQNRAMNLYMSNLYIQAIMDVSKDDRKELHRLYTRISTSKKGSAYDETIKLPTGLPITGCIGQACDAKFKKSLKDGLMYGKVSLPVYKNNNPLLVHVDYVKLRKNSKIDNGLYHNYSDHMEFLDHLYKKDAEILLKFANGITFKLNLGNDLKKSHEIRTIMQKVFEEEYGVCGSQIQLQKRKSGKGDDIFLLLCLAIPEDKVELDENVVVGVDLGIATPAVCALNTMWQPRKFIGTYKNFTDKRKQMKEEYRRVYKTLQYCKGGHGRKKKLKHLETLSEHEKHFAETYNHKVSKEIVDFALKNHAKYINIEDLSGIDPEHKFLGVWGYYQVQSYIEYKAKRYGIEVRKINPFHTSQMCSKCGHWEEGQRDGRDFVCKECGFKANADYNAARNISMSQDFVEETKAKSKSKKTA